LSACFDLVIDRLRARNCDPQQNGAGWKARCPSHEDQKPSLSVTEGDDGRVLLCCHTGCAYQDVVKALDMVEADLFPPDPTRTPATKSKAKAKKGDGWATMAEVVSYLLWKLAKEDKKKRRVTAGDCYSYGSDFAVQRLNYDDGDKEFRPIFRVMGRWQLTVPKGKRPLYHRDDLAAASRIYVTEGEKCAGLVRGLGLIATTSSGGANAANKTDWSDLAAKEVILIPDNDEPGEKYNNDVSSVPKGRLRGRPSIGGDTSSG
jgi:putative DNA primase/helicase